ncbi:MAG: hypothetical protein LBJ69_00250 [Holosporales bacterium]|nr:hypothetical protein [Holosporales bacterium]
MRIMKALCLAIAITTAANAAQSILQAEYESSVEYFRANVTSIVNEDQARQQAEEILGETGGEGEQLNARLAQAQKEQDDQPKNTALNALWARTIATHLLEQPQPVQRVTLRALGVATFPYQTGIAMPLHGAWPNKIAEIPDTLQDIAFQIAVHEQIIADGKAKAAAEMQNADAEILLFRGSQLLPRMRALASRVEALAEGEANTAKQTMAVHLALFFANPQLESQVLGQLDALEDALNA